MKKLFSILSAAVIVLSVAAVMAFAVGDGKNRGDVNGDGKVDSADAMLVMKCDAGLLSLSNDEIKRADLNGDGKIDSCDAVYILRIAAGLKVPDAETTAKGLRPFPSRQPKKQRSRQRKILRSPRSL